jgi:hypothetical protein
MFSINCALYKKLSFNINTLIICPKYRQIKEPSRDQRKFPADPKLSPDLSTGIVDSFPLALCGAPLQHGTGITPVRI